MDTPSSSTRPNAISLAAPRPSYVRKGSSITQTISPRSPVSLEEPARLVDRRLGELATHMHLPLGPQRPEARRSAPSVDTLRTVHFIDSPRAEFLPMQALTPGGRHVIELPPARVRITPKLFGQRTKFRPLYLLALGNAGSALFGSGEVVVQRAVFPAKDYAGLNPKGGVTAIPGGSAGYGTAFGGRIQGIVAGSVFMAVGIGAAVTAATLFVRDGRALNRRQNAQAPNYRRTMTYFYAHMTGIGLLVSHRFALEVFRLYLPPAFLWAGTIPGAVGQALFAVTQAQSFSSSEVYNGKMPLPYRAQISAAARAGVAFYIFVGAIVATPNLSAYWRESVRLLAQTCTALAYSLPLTTARLAAPLPRAEAGVERRRGDFTALQSFTVYAIARMISSAAATQMQHARWPAQAPPAGPPPDDVPDGEDDTGCWRNLPCPIPTGPSDPEYVAFGAFLLGLSICMGLYSFWELRKDALGQGRRYADGMFAAAALSLLPGNVWRVVGEHAKEHADFRQVWDAAPIGFVANALAFVAIPELYSCSEVTRGNAPIPYRYQVTEACRAGGNLCWTLWSAMAATLGFPPIIRQTMVWSASIFTILGMALPDADTRRAQIGSNTPSDEVPQWLGAGSPRALSA